MSHGCWPDGKKQNRRVISNHILNISNLVLKIGEDAVEAVAAVSSRWKTSYVRVTASRPVEDARRLYAIGTDRFLISWLDTT